MSHAKYSELTFQGIVEATPNAIILVNKDGRIAYVNSQTEKLFGYDRSGLVGQGVEILIPDRYHKNHPQFREMFFTSPETRAMGSGRELFAVRKNKTEFPVEIGLNPMVTADGTMVLASIIDISARKKAEESFRLVVESAPNAMILTNSKGIIILINNQTEKLFGYERKELIGNKLEIFIPERLRKTHPKHRDNFFASPSVRAMGAGRELFAMRKDGTEFPVEIGLNPIETEEGTLVLASVIDISARKKAEESFRLVVESAPNAMILTNKDGLITLVNNQTEKLFGYERKELVGNKLEIFIPERLRKTHPKHRDNFFAMPSVRAMGAGRELFAMRKDGTEFPVEIGLNPIETEEGTLVLASVIDITERKRQKQLTELEARNKELEQFNYIASHDLQEPLRTVSNYIQILEEDYFDQISPEAKQHLDTINRAAKRMSSLVHSLLDFSRVGRNKQLVSVDCNQVVGNVIADLGAIIKSSKAKIKVAELPVLKVLETEMRQLLQNLINNAIEFRKETVAPEIEITCTDLSTHYEFCIADNGIGIEEKNFEKIFYIFNRLNPHDPLSEYGIGLANCRKIVELHSGKIWVESEVGVGSKFRFTIANL